MPAVYRKIATTMLIGAAAAVRSGGCSRHRGCWSCARGVLGVVWFVAIGRFLGAHAWSELDDDSDVREADAAPPPVRSLPQVWE